MTFQDRGFKSRYAHLNLPTWQRVNPLQPVIVPITKTQTKTKLDLNGSKRSFERLK